MRKELGSILLVAGCCIGAGMLGLPVLTAESGFIPTGIAFILAWAFMMTTGFIFLEVAVSYEKRGINFVTMSRETLGRYGQWVTIGLFAFLFYALLVAYVVGSGGMVVDFMHYALNVDIPFWMGNLFLTLLFIIFLFQGVHVIDIANRWMILALAVCYLLLVGLGVQEVDFRKLSFQNWGQAVWVMPVLIISFGYHNMIPSLSDYLYKNTAQLKRVIAIGGVIPLFIYLLWEWVTLGLIPLEGNEGFIAAKREGRMVTHMLYYCVGSKWVIYASQGFAFFAIITSFLGVALSFIDFMRDAFESSGIQCHKIGLASLVMIPPFIASLNCPGVFLTALNYAGGIGAVALFGLIPSIMLWKKLFLSKEIASPKVFKWTKSILLMVIVISIAIMSIEICNEIIKVL